MRLMLEHLEHVRAQPEKDLEMVKNVSDVVRSHHVINMLKKIVKERYSRDDIQHSPWNSTLRLEIACVRDFYVLRSNMESTPKSKL